MGDALYSYQERGAIWLSGHGRPHRYLAWEPGLGKTATSVAACDRLGASRVLVLAPAHSVYNWQREFKRWQTKFRSVRIAPSLSFQPTLDLPNVLICSFAVASTPGVALRQHLMRAEWDVLIVDEAQGFNEEDSNRTKFLWGRGMLHTRAKHVFPLSGTPATKHAGELYPVLSALHPSSVKGLTREAFEDKFCRVTKFRLGARTIRRVEGTNLARIPDLRRRLAGFMDIKKSDDPDVGLDLPPLRMTQCTIDAMHLSNATSILAEDRELAAKLLAKTDEQDIMAVLQAGDVAFATERRVIGMAKAQVICDILDVEMLQTAKKILVFAQHRLALDTFCGRLSHHGIVRIDGSDDAKAKTKAQDTFQQDPDVRVAVIQIKAGSTNLTMTAAQDVVLAEPSWNPSDNWQAIKRAARIGQTKPVHARFFALSGADDRLTSVLRERTEEMSRLFSSKKVEEDAR